MAALASSPDTSLYVVGKGEVYFQKDFTGSFRHVGNVAELEFEAEFAELDHYSSMGGVKSLDQSTVLSVSATLRMLMDEWSPDNVAMAFLGEVTELASPVGATEIDILSVTKIEGAVRYIGTNEIGPKFTFDFASAAFRPSDAIALISDEYAQMELTAKLAKRLGTFGTITQLGA